MLRKIIHIDEEKCNGCGVCAAACHEGAIGMVGGKARLLRDDYCDGLGDCLPVCPTGAIRFVEREAAAYDEKAVLLNKQQGQKTPCACPGAQARSLAPSAEDSESQLRQWPVQIKLAPPAAPYLDGADLLVAADCSAYAYARFHQDFIRGRVALVGCPKLDSVDYSEKLGDILSHNNIRSITVARMEVPCCGGMEKAVRGALEKSRKSIPLNIAVLSTDGRIIRR